MQTRGPLWEVILYPDSRPDFWQDVIEDTKVPCVLSPCHNMDRWTLKDEAKNPEHRAGELKKPHFHLFIDYGSGANKTEQQVTDDFVIPLNGREHPELVKSARGMVRYLIHLDHPAKAQYRLDEIRFFNGYDVKDYFELSNAEVDDMSLKIREFIVDNSITEYSRLVDICAVTDLHWFKYVRQNSLFFTAYLRSFRHSGDAALSQAGEAADKAAAKDSKSNDTK